MLSIRRYLCGSEYIQNIVFLNYVKTNEKHEMCEGGGNMRYIDADILKEKILAERDKIPLEITERYSFGVPTPYRHGQSMRGGIRVALRCMEETPTVDINAMLSSKPCDFCETNQEWEDKDNGFFMELRLDPPWIELHINLGYDSLKENDIEIDLNYCPKCGRKLKSDC